MFASENAVKNRENEKKQKLSHWGFVFYVVNYCFFLIAKFLSTTLAQVICIAIAKCAKRIFCELMKMKKMK